MKIAIVGVGNIGSKYAVYSEASNNILIKIDPRYFKNSKINEYGSILTIPAKLSLSIDVWVVSTPTSFHLENIKEILKINPKAKMLVEKPIVLVNEFEEFENILKVFKDASVVVNDIYKHSSVTNTFIQNIENLKQNTEIVSISMEFSKNRIKDEVGGRFQDSSYGVMGYEGFHLFSLMKIILNEKDFDQLLNTCDDNSFTPSGDFCLDFNLLSGVHVQMASSIKGNLILNTKTKKIYRSNEAREKILKQKINYGSEFRFRFIEVVFQDGTILTLAYEPYFGFEYRDYKNEHEIIVAIDEETSVEKLKINQLEESFSKQVETLVYSNSVEREIEMEIHNKLARLASAFNCEKQNSSKAKDILYA
jgi:hypothetical protein